jgi:hypothetical protein
MGGAEMGPLSLYRPDSDRNGLIPWNAQLRTEGCIHFCASHVFAKETGFAFYFATVPQLADSRGLQPVVYIEAMEMPYSVPVASSVDRFFETYSHYLELMVVDPEYIQSRVPEAVFPWGASQLIARDTLLLEMIRAGQFSFLTEDDDETNDWLARLCAMPPKY